MSGKKSGSASPIRVLYDGWPLSCAGAGENQAALHVLELLDAQPENIEVCLALPGEIAQEISATVHVVVAPETPTSAGRLRWEQIRLPGLARRVGADVLHTTSANLPVFCPAPCLVSPVENLAYAPAGQGMARRLRESLGTAGLSNAAGLLWPLDLPAPDHHLPIRRLPPHVHPAFYTAQEMLFSDPFILVPGPLDREEIHLLAAIWSWVSLGLGEEWALKVSDLSGEGLNQLQAACQSPGLAAESDSSRIQMLALHTPSQRAAAFQQAQVVLNISPVRPWSDTLLQALASGRPLVGVETPWADARIGPAGYLAAAGDARSLGAAVLTLITEDSVAERLSQLARQRAQAWDQNTGNGQAFSFRQALGHIYHTVAAG